MTTPPAVWSRGLAELMIAAFTRCAAETGDVGETIRTVAKECEADVREHLAVMLDDELERVGRLGAPRHRRQSLLRDVARWLRGEIVLDAVGHAHPDAATVAAIGRDPMELRQLSDDTGPTVLAQAWAKGSAT